jgi:membrane protease YdiL (CAAX protease family)
MTQDLQGGGRAVGWMAGLYAGLAAAACAWIGWRSGADGFRALAGDGWPGAALGAGLAAGIAVAGRAAGRRFRWYAAMEAELADALGPLGFRPVAALALASGMAEELFFRGALQGAVGWIVAGLAFGLLHLPVRRALVPWTMLATALGLLFGWIADRSGGIVGVTVAHVGINAVNLWRMCGGERTERD